MRALTDGDANVDAMTSPDQLSAAMEAGAATRMECNVCWYVYDPADGDPVWQIPPATPWSELPEHWTCPTCSTTRDGFLVLPDG